VTYAPRLYPEIVVDLLTTLTGGTVRESLLVPQTGDLPKLANRPVRRVSNLVGQVAAKDGTPIDFKFTSADFELVSSTGGTDLDLIRFRDGGRRPAPATTLTVNYYPVQTPPTPLTDLNVGSVVRTLMESVARELAVTYLHLQKVYDSAFIDTAEGNSLDRVVALVGMTRLPADHPIAKVTFSRRPDSAGRITVPPGTAVTDAKGNRYLTAVAITLEPNEGALDVFCVGADAGTKPVGAGELNRVEIAVAGISTVANAEPSRLLGAGETDEDLRRRARAALHGAVRGTVSALKFGLLSIAGVKSVDITEKTPGVIGLSVAYDSDPPTPELLQAVEDRILEFRPAGILVSRDDAKGLTVDAAVRLTLAGSGVAPSDLPGITEPIKADLTAYLRGLPPGSTARKSKLQSLALKDPRVADAKVVLQPASGAETEELALQSGRVIIVGAIQFPTPNAERAPSRTLTVNAVLPLHLVGTTTAAEAQDALNKSVAAWIGKLGGSLPITVDGLLGNVRDDSRYALLPDAALLNLERDDQRFFQLTSGQGRYDVATGERVLLGKVDLQVRAGSV
jgi:uncharacterized phage protein gp47/JayE